MMTQTSGQSWYEIARQSTSTVLAASAIIVLTLLNNNIHTLVTCFTSASTGPSPQPLYPVRPARVANAQMPAEETTDCMYKMMGAGNTSIGISYCAAADGSRSTPETLAVHLNGTKERVYSGEEARQLIAWIKACHGDPTDATCGASPSARPLDPCRFIARHTAAELMCFDSHYHLIYLVLAFIQFPPADSLSIAHFIHRLM